MKINQKLVTIQSMTKSYFKKKLEHFNLSYSHISQLNDNLENQQFCKEGNYENQKLSSHQKWQDGFGENCHHLTWLAIP